MEEIKNEQSPEATQASKDTPLRMLTEDEKAILSTEVGELYKAIDNFTKKTQHGIGIVHSELMTLKPTYGTSILQIVTVDPLFRAVGKLTEDEKKSPQGIELLDYYNHIYPIHLAHDMVDYCMSIENNRDQPEFTQNFINEFMKKYTAIVAPQDPNEIFKNLEKKSKE